MLIAQNGQGDLVNLLEDVPQRQEFFCPACHQSVRLKNGKVMRPHFAHVNLKSCAFFQENESDEHLTLKAELFASLSKNTVVEVEKILSDSGQIADLFVGEKLVLEVQCSRLSEARLRERTNNYHQAGYQVLWLLGEKLWLGKKISRLQKQFLYFSQNMGFHYWELDLKKRHIRLKYLIYEDLEGHLSYLEKSCSLDQDVLEFLRLPYKRQCLSYYEKRQNQQILSVIQRGLMARNPRWLSRQAEIYVCGGNLLAQSIDDFFPQIRPIESKEGFCQIRRDLSQFSSAFFQYYQKQKERECQILYPPVFYDNACKNKIK